MIWTQLSCKTVASWRWKINFVIYIKIFPKVKMPFFKEVLILRDFHQDIHGFPFLQLISIVKNTHYAGCRNASSRFPKARRAAQVLSDVCTASLLLSFWAAVASAWWPCSASWRGLHLMTDGVKRPTHFSSAGRGWTTLGTPPGFPWVDWACLWTCSAAQLLPLLNPISFPSPGIDIRGAVKKFAEWEFPSGIVA